MCELCAKLGLSKLAIESAVQIVPPEANRLIVDAAFTPDGNYVGCAKAQTGGRKTLSGCGIATINFASTEVSAQARAGFSRQGEISGQPHSSQRRA